MTSSPTSLRFASHGSTRGQVLRALKSFYAWAEDRELLVNPTRRLKVPRPKYGPAPHLTREEMIRVLVAAAWRDERRAWAILLAYATGARADSLCHVTAQDVRGETLHLRVAKGDRPYAVPLGTLGLAAVAGLLPHSNGTLLGVKYGRFWEWVNQASKDSGVKVWPHLLRHTTATNIYKATKDPLMVKELLNHADLSQVPRYVHMADDAKRAAMEDAL